MKECDKYIIDIKELKRLHEIYDESQDIREEFVYILYNEYGLGAFKEGDGNNVLVRIHNDEQTKKLIDALKTYGASKEYAKEVFNVSESYVENKLNDKNMKSFNKRINALFEAEALKGADIIELLLSCVEETVHAAIDEEYENYEIEDLIAEVGDKLKNHSDDFKRFLVDNAEKMDDVVYDFIFGGDGLNLEAPVEDVSAEDVPAAEPIEDVRLELEDEASESAILEDEDVDESTIAEVGDRVEDAVVDDPSIREIQELISEISAESDAVDSSVEEPAIEDDEVVEPQGDGDYIDKAMSEGAVFAFKSDINEAARVDRKTLNKVAKKEGAKSELAAVRKEIQEELKELVDSFVDRVGVSGIKTLLNKKVVDKKQVMDILKSRGAKGKFAEDLNRIIELKTALNPIESAIEEKNESVTSKFSKYRRMFESDEEGEGESEKSEEKPADDAKPKEDKGAAEDVQDEEVDLTGVAVTIKESDFDKFKEFLVSQGVSEDAIEKEESSKESKDEETNESEDEDDDEDPLADLFGDEGWGDSEDGENGEGSESEEGDEKSDKEEEVRVVISVESEEDFNTLKDAMSKLGVDIEEELGGEAASSDSKGDEEEEK